MASPAGTMIQTARGFGSCSTSSAIENDPMAPWPSPTISVVFSGVRLNTTISCPSRTSRRTMLAPIRPSPMKPMRIEVMPPVYWSSAVASALSSAVSPATGSAPRWIRTIGRSWDSMAAKSPAAWASMSWPNVYGQSGIARSAGWSAVSWRNQPIGAPPLCSWPVEWRKRGP